MKKLYYHPESKSKTNGPVFADTNQYNSVYLFLQEIEELEPKAVVELRELVPLYQQVEASKDEVPLDWTEWDVLIVASESKYPSLVPIREAVKEWALKYGLVDVECNEPLYIIIGIWALGSLSSHGEFIEDVSRIAREEGRAVPYWLLNWSLANSVHLEPDEDDIRLKEDFGESDFSSIYPFTFTPGLLSGWFFESKTDEERKKLEADFYEDLLCYTESLTLKSFDSQVPAWKGKGWDPRHEQWADFEEEMDLAYQYYKKAYKERTEAFMKANGYVVGPEKRNLEHFKWLVRYQVQGWKASRIADWYSKGSKCISEDAVYKALKSTAALVGITLRNSN